MGYRELPRVRFEPSASLLRRGTEGEADSPKTSDYSERLHGSALAQTVSRREKRPTVLRSLTWIAATGVVLLGAAHWAAAQDDWDAKERAATGPDEQPHFNAELNLNHQIFRSGAPAQARAKIDSMLTLRLESLERAGGLSPSQVEKLRLAGRADVTRFFRDVDALIEECKGLNVNDERFQKIWPKVNVMQAKLGAGLFNESSLFQKVLDGMARPGASAPYQQQEQDRRKFRHRAAAELALTTFEFGVPLTDDQRQKFLKLILEECEPPKSFGQMDDYVVLYQASKLDRKKLKPIFDDAQWRALEDTLRRVSGMEAMLKERGFVP